MFDIYEKVNQALLTWSTSMRENNIPINGRPRLEELTNLLKHLTATLSSYQTDGLEMEREVRPDCLFIRS